MPTPAGGSTSPPGDAPRNRTSPDRRWRPRPACHCLSSPHCSTLGEDTSIYPAWTISTISPPSPTAIGTTPPLRWVRGTGGWLEQGGAAGRRSPAGSEEVDGDVHEFASVPAFRSPARSVSGRGRGRRPRLGGPSWTVGVAGRHGLADAGPVLARGERDAAAAVPRRRLLVPRLSPAGRRARAGARGIRSRVATSRAGDRRGGRDVGVDLDGGRRQRPAPVRPERGADGLLERAVQRPHGGGRRSGRPTAPCGGVDLLHRAARTAATPSDRRTPPLQPGSGPHRVPAVAGRAVPGRPPRPRPRVGDRDWRQARPVDRPVARRSPLGDRPDPRRRDGRGSAPDAAPAGRRGADRLALVVELR